VKGDATRRLVPRALAEGREAAVTAAVISKAGLRCTRPLIFGESIFGGAQFAGMPLRDSA
jgi:hypothetical protein